MLCKKNWCYFFNNYDLYFLINLTYKLLSIHQNRNRIMETDFKVILKNENNDVYYESKLQGPGLKK